MNIHFRSFNQVVSGCLEQLRALTSQQKKVLGICLAAFACLYATYFIIKRCCFKAKPLNPVDPKPPVPVFPEPELLLPDQSPISVLPNEILTHIFEIGLKDALPIGKEHIFCPNQVCKQWNQAFENTFVARLRNNKFSPSMNTLYLADLADTQEQFVKLNHYIGGKNNPHWIENWMLDPTNSKAKNDFILKNMWFTHFRTDIQTPHAAIQANLDLIKNVTNYEFGNYSLGIKFFEQNQGKVLPADLYKALIKEYAWAFKHVSKNFNELNIEGLWIGSGKFYKEFNQYVPEELRIEMCLEALKNGWPLRCIPEELKTEEICLTAVKQNGEALKFVPEDLRTEEICLTAVKQNGEALEFVPEELKTKEMCLAAKKNKGWLDNIFWRNGN